MYLSLLVRRCAGHTIVDVTGELDVNSAGWLQDRLQQIMWGSGTCLLVDLSAVTFIDCFGTRLLVETCRNAERQACSIRFIALSAPVRRLANLTGLDREMPLTGPSTVGIPSGYAVPSLPRSAETFRPPARSPQCDRQPALGGLGGSVGGLR